MLGIYFLYMFGHGDGYTILIMTYSFPLFSDMETYVILRLKARIGDYLAFVASMGRQ